MNATRLNETRPSATRPNATRRTGLLLALGTACISGVAIFLNSYGVKAFGDASTYTTAKNVVAARVLILLTGAMSMRRHGTVLTGRRGRGTGRDSRSSVYSAYSAQRCWPDLSDPRTRLGPGRPARRRAQSHLLS